MNPLGAGILPGRHEERHYIQVNSATQRDNRKLPPLIAGTTRKLITWRKCTSMLDSQR